MKAIKILTAMVIFLFILISTAFNQIISFTERPADLQLYPRDQQDSAAVTISGTVTEPGYNAVKVDVFKNSDLWKSSGQSLSYSNGTASFNLQPKIHAELSEYHFKVYLDDHLVAEADSVVCGDVFLINGQSNSHPGDASITERSEFWRSFGRHTDYEPYNPADTTWGLSTPEGWCDSCLYAVGVWGFRLQKLISGRYGIPTCFINGGSGGSSISYNLPDSADHFNLNTTYGRLLYRATKAKVDQNVKAILWHQGESDSNSDDAPLYHERFTELRTAWKSDYSPLTKIYVFQIRPGCGGDAQQSLRETQRRFPQYFDDVELMSTCGLDGHDDCHYNTEGYNQMAGWVFRLIARDFYGSDDTVHIKPPDIKKVYYADENHNKIIMEFSDDVSWPADTLNHSLEDHIYLDGEYGYISKGQDGAEPHILELDLTAPLSATKITYLPNQYYNRPPTKNYQGPWIRNPRSVGALSFHEFPIEDVVSHIGRNAVSDFDLKQNYPNPFNPQTTIRFSLDQGAHTGLAIYDGQGRLIRVIHDGFLAAGNHRFAWDGKNSAGEKVASGTYYYQIQSGTRQLEKKMLLIR